MKPGPSRIGRLAAVTLAFAAAPALAQEETTWASLKTQILGERPTEDGAGLVELVAPKRAEDAAIVPVEVRVRARRATGAGSRRSPSSSTRTPPPSPRPSGSARRPRTSTCRPGCG
jgi:sulfur-oxidizing protein SoxY